jgi:RNA polymerase sigma factor (sigma-70 family)
MAIGGSKRPTLRVVSRSSKAVDRRPGRSDEAILAAVRAGDGTVADDFYWRIKPVVERTIRRLLSWSTGDGEDLVQIALIEIIESLPRYRGESPLDAWVAAVSANVVYKYIRRRRLERRIFESAFEIRDVSIATPGEGPRRMVMRDMARHVARHLADMRPHWSWAFLLHDVCGYSLVEISKICGISPAAAQSRLVRGRRDLHCRIADDTTLANALDEDKR